MTVQLTRRLTKAPARFPNSIREYRLKAGLTQTGLARLVGHHRSIVSAWECGRRLPSLPNALRLARELDTLTEALYARLYGMHTPEEGRKRQQTP